MLERKIIQERLSQEKLKKIFQPDPNTKASVPEGIKRWKKKVAARIRYGRDNNFTKGKIYRGLDLAWEQANNTVSPTIVRALLGTVTPDTKESKEAENILKTWGINIDDIIIPADPKTPGSKAEINIPAFYQVAVPLMKSYCTIRWASIFNERNRTPLFEYDPAFSNETSRLQAAAVTARVEVMSRQMGYANVMKQRIYNMLHYGQCFTFPLEEWWTEEQETADTEYAAKNDNGKASRDKKSRMYRIIKEGIRFDIPHPSRVFYDEFHRPSTFNTGTGCTFAGSWKIVRYGDVRNNKSFWNTDKVNMGDGTWWKTMNASAFFQAVYPCQMEFPTIPTMSDTDRETKLASNYYTGEMEDAACCLVNYVEQLVPSEHDMGDYDYPVWMRFIIAGDDTVVYAAPCGYAPVIWEGYDADENRANANSLSLETLAFQDQFSQQMSQLVLSCQQNLANITFFDSDAIEDAPGLIKTISNLGKRFYTKLNFHNYSGNKMRKAQYSVGAGQVFQSQTFPKANLQENFMVMKMILDTMERVLVMSAQEVGAAASHEQSKFEVQKTHEAKGTRLQFTATPTDQANETMKQMLYEALMFHGSEDFWVQIPYQPSFDKETLEKLGFTWDEDTHPMGETDNKITVKAKKSAIAYLSFAEKRDDLEMRDNPEAAVQMLQVLQGLMQTPIGPAIGIDQSLKILNLVFRQLGFPKDFKLENKMKNEPPEEQQKWFMEQLKGLEESIIKQVGGALTQVMEPVAMKLQEHDAAIEKIVEFILPPQQGPPMPPEMMGPQPGMIPPPEAMGLPPMVSPDEQLLAAAAEQGITGMVDPATAPALTGP